MMTISSIQRSMTSLAFLLTLVFGAVQSVQAQTWTISNAGFATPESVEYNSASDEYLVSQVNGHPLDEDGNGFVSRLSPTGEVLELKWLQSQPGKFTFHGPKGLAIAGANLFVADLQAVHVFNLPTGAHKRTIDIEGASVLNGVSPTGDGSVIVTDTGYRKTADGIGPSGTDALFRVWPDGRYEAIARDSEMGHPNGVFYTGDGEMLVVTFGTGALFRMNLDGEREDLPKPPKGTLDGVEQLPDGRILVSGWEGDAIYALENNGQYSVVLDSIKDPADLGYDSKRNRLLIPLTNSDEVVIHELGQ